MPFPYTSFRYFYPPRAEVEKSPEALDGLEIEGWWAQVKKDGSNSLVFVYPNRTIDGWNRRGTRHKRWMFSAETAAPFAAIPGNQWFVFNGELMHNQTKHIKNIHFIYDILVCNSVHLTGTTYEFRYQLLLDIFLGGHAPKVRAAVDHFVVHPHLWIARNFKRDLRKRFDSLTESEDEGLVLRSPQGVYYTPKTDSWMVKVKR